MRATDTLPDHLDYTERQGVVIRKGTVGAFLVNAQIWTDPTATAASRQTAERDLLDALPALRALGLFDVLSIRNDALRQFVDRH